MKPPDRVETQAPVRLWLLTLIVFSGTLAMHIFVPALPRAAVDLGVSSAHIQQTVSFYILGLAGAQLIYGPISDRFGRRRTLIAGLVLYTAAGVVAALATEIQLLVVARLFQALGGGAGLVLGRAMVRDTSSDTDTVRKLALMNLVTTAGPALAPVVGAVIVEALGWRPIFWALCILGATNILLAWRMLPETNRTAAASEIPLKQSYMQLLRTPVLLACCLGAGCATTSMYAFIAAAPFMFVEQMQRSPHEVGIFLGILVSGITLGAVVVGRIYTRVSSIDIVIRATLLSLICATVMLGAALAGYLNAYFFVVMSFLLTLGIGIAAPASLAIAMSINRQAVGSASGLYGFTQMTVGAICTALVGIGDNPALAATLILTGAMLISQACFWYIRFSRKLKT